MNFYVVLSRPGFRVAERRRCKSKIGAQHRITREESIKWFQQKVCFIFFSVFIVFIFNSFFFSSTELFCLGRKSKNEKNSNSWCRKVEKKVLCFFVALI